MAEGFDHTFSSRETGKRLRSLSKTFIRQGQRRYTSSDTETHNGTVYGGAILVVLPQDSGARAKIFAMDKTVARAFDEDTVSDQGQKYLYHAFD